MAEQFEYYSDEEQDKDIKKAHGTYVPPSNEASNGFCTFCGEEMSREYKVWHGRRLTGLVSELCLECDKCGSKAIVQIIVYAPTTAISTPINIPKSKFVPNPV